MSRSLEWRVVCERLPARQPRVDLLRGARPADAVGNNIRRRRGAALASRGRSPWRSRIGGGVENATAGFSFHEIAVDKPDAAGVDRGGCSKRVHAFRAAVGAAVRNLSRRLPQKSLANMPARARWRAFGTVAWRT